MKNSDGTNKLTRLDIKNKAVANNNIIVEELTSNSFISDKNSVSENIHTIVKEIIEVVDVLESNRGDSDSTSKFNSESDVSELKKSEESIEPGKL